MSSEDGWNWVWQRFHGLDPRGIGDVSGDSGAAGILGQQAPSGSQLVVTSVLPASPNDPDGETAPVSAALIPQAAHNSPTALDSGVLGRLDDTGAAKVETAAKKPWSLFGKPTPEAAAVAALDYYNPISIADKKERTGTVMGLPYLGYFALPPTLNGYAGDTNAPGCVGCSNYYHTHGSSDKSYLGEQFSPADRGLAQVPAGGVSGPVPMYLGTPSGAIIMYDPVTGHERRIK